MEHAVVLVTKKKGRSYGCACDDCLSATFFYKMASSLAKSFARQLKRAPIRRENPIRRELIMRLDKTPKLSAVLVFVLRS